MLDTFKAQLKAKLKTLGVKNLSQKRIDAIADRLHKKYPDITEVADHDTHIDELNELSPFEEIAKADDRVRTAEAKAKGQPPKKDDPDDVDDIDEPAKPNQGDEVPKWAQTLLDKVTKLETEKTQGSIRSQAAKKLKDIPEVFWSKRALPEKEEDLDDFISDVETDWTALKQDKNNQILTGGTTPASGSTTITAGKEDADIEAWAAKSKPVATAAGK